jgi:hypothetical protein
MSLKNLDVANERSIEAWAK